MMHIACRCVRVVAALLATMLVAVSSGVSLAADSHSIAEIQGPGDRSPYEGRKVTVSGAVTGDFQDHDNDTSANLGGFFLQSEEPDDDPQTSEGLFVFDGNSGTDVSAGQLVRVSGTVQEHYGETQLKASSIRILGKAGINATALQLPVESVVENADGDLVADLEAVEGMLVALPQRLTVTDLYELEAFGSIVLSEGGRLFQFTNQAAPDVKAYEEHRRTNAGRSIVLDDGRRDSGKLPIRFLRADGDMLRTGDSVSGIVGNLRYSRGSGGRGNEAWRLMPAREPEFRKDNPRPQAPARRGSLRVASLNVLNYFSGIDTGAPRCGPTASHPCRGADSPEEKARQLQKIVAALTAMNADIIALVELENNETQSLDDIAAAVNARTGSGEYVPVATGAIGRDTIKTGFLYRPIVVQPVGLHALLTSDIDARFDETRHRPALAQSFATRLGRKTLTVTVLHMKSKGSDCDDDGDPNTGDGQGNCNVTRTQGMAAVADWLRSDPTDSHDPDHLVVGDFNAYKLEDPVASLQRSGFIDLVGNDGGPSYTFVYDGQAGALDHAFATPSLVRQVVQAGIWAINADEARLHDYNLDGGRSANLFDPDSPYRSADHDPLFIDLNLE